MTAGGKKLLKLMSAQNVAHASSGVRLQVPNGFCNTKTDSFVPVAYARDPRSLATVAQLLIWIGINKRLLRRLLLPSSLRIRLRNGVGQVMSSCRLGPRLLPVRVRSNEGKIESQGAVQGVRFETGTVTVKSCLGTPCITSLRVVPFSPLR